MTRTAGQRVTRGQVCVRGLLHRCPNCGAATLFGRWLRMNERCRQCGLKFEREDGFFLGALVFDYTFIAVFTLFPVLILIFTQVIDMRAGLIIAAVCAVVGAFLFHPTSKSLWLMTYYVVVIDDLPANRTEAQRPTSV